ncbi:PI-PLC X domain-containing protein 3-like [Clytia hemisphaerica]|uniref:Phosphatidylinositol-specific phospholipase C X domain-containing protein n=1 Tax=Clytia hemisphaerica TaxID=252671 RepID=A0A7M5X6R3_9CNID
MSSLCFLFVLIWLGDRVFCQGSCRNHSDWMNHLPIEMHKMKITEIAIPGSHDSGTYSLMKTSDIFIDGSSHKNDIILDFLKFRSQYKQNGLLGELIYRWSITQDLNITSQLYCGVRYLDLRIAFDHRNESRVVHGLFGTTLHDIFTQIKDFIIKYSKEIILLDLQSMATNHEISKENALKNVTDLLQDFFSDRIIFAENIQSYKLKDLWQQNISVIVFKRSRDNNKKDSILHAHASIRSPFDYKQFTQTWSWLHFLDLNYANRGKQGTDTFYVTQGIMQPHWMEVVIAGISENATLRSWVSSKATRKIRDWLHGKHIGKNGINIVIADFVEFSNFTDTVLDLNAVTNVRGPTSRKSGSVCYRSIDNNLLWLLLIIFMLLERY